VDLTDLALGIIVLAIVVTIGASIMINIRDTSLTKSNVVTTKGEALTFTGNTATLTNKWGKGVISVQNQSAGVPLSATNYTVSTNTVDGTITITNLTSYNQPWSVNYTWYNTSSRPDYTVSNQAATGLAEYGNWFKIIVIVGVAAVILSLIFMAFGRRGESNSASY
jgi:hypothetical protein